MANKTSITDEIEDDTTVFVRVFINKQYELTENINTSQDIWKLAELFKSQIDMESLREDIPQAFRKAKWIKPLFKNKKQYTWKIYSYNPDDPTVADLEIEDDDDLQEEDNDGNVSGKDPIHDDEKYLRLRVVFFNNNKKEQEQEPPPVIHNNNNNNNNNNNDINIDESDLGMIPIIENEWNDLINGLKVDETHSSKVLESHKDEWQFVLQILQKNKPKILEIPNSSFRRNAYQFNPLKLPSKNEFALSLSEIFEEDNNIYFITSNIQSTINELTKSQSTDDMYNSEKRNNGKPRYPQYNWCIFLNGDCSQNGYKAGCNVWKSFYIFDEKNWQKYRIILESKKQITLKHNDTTNKNKYWYLRINKYRYNERIGGDIHCIVECKPVMDETIIARNYDIELSLKLLNECDLIKLFCHNQITLVIVDFCGGNFVWNWWYKFITELEYDGKAEQHIENKNEWYKIQHLLQKWDVNDITNFNVPQYKWLTWYPLNPDKIVNENKFGLSLYPILLKQRSIGRSRDILCYIKSNDKQIVDELIKAQLLSDEYKYNSVKHYDTNWCIFVHKYVQLYNKYPNYYSYDTWMTSQHLNYTTVFCCRQQITLLNRQFNDKKYWFLKIHEYETNIKMGKNIYCIVECDIECNM